MSEADVTHLADRVYMTLSGGERARAALARVMSQDTGAVLLDEPTAALDIRHQEQVMALLKRKAGESLTVVTVLHDLTLTAAYADKVTLVSDGEIVASGTPEEVLTGALLSDVYRHPIHILVHPDTGGMLIVPTRS